MKAGIIDTVIYFHESSSYINSLLCNRAPLLVGPSLSLTLFPSTSPSLFPFPISLFLFL